MGLYYTHLLIPGKPKLSPPIDSVCRFLQGVIDTGFVGGEPNIVLVRIEEQLEPVQAYIDYFVKKFPKEPRPVQRVQRRVKKLYPVKDAVELQRKAAKFPEFDAAVCGEGTPKLLAVKVRGEEDGKWKPWNKAHYIGIGCCIRDTIISTSDYHEETGSKRRVIPFGEECSVRNRLGIFTNPSTSAPIEVPNAGCARFWIEIRYGKFLFPEIRNGNLAIVHPGLLKLATDAFAVDFAQGCQWG